MSPETAAIRVTNVIPSWVGCGVEMPSTAEVAVAVGERFFECLQLYRTWKQTLQLVQRPPQVAKFNDPGSPLLVNDPGY